MYCRSKNIIQNLVESRKQETIRIYNQYHDAMDLRTGNDKREKRLIKTILSDFPDEEKANPHNLD
jgi:hypothetical protein